MRRWRSRWDRAARGGIGLRGRIVGAVLITAVATLGVAAIALLGPLEAKLRSAGLQSLQKNLSKDPAAPFRALPLAQLGDATRTVLVHGRRLPLDRYVTNELRRTERELAEGVGAGTIVRVLGYPGPDGRGTVLAPSPLGDTGEPPDPFDDVAQAFRTHRTVRGFGFIGGGEYAREAIPFTQNGLAFVLAVRRPAGEIHDATRVVQTAFITAALSGLGLTIMLGIPLSARLVRRLRRLRLAALELARSGPGVELPDDRVRDEVGDLARTFAIMQERLRHQEEARRAFVATASHELRTPLASLDGMLELLDDDLRADRVDIEDAQALLTRARNQSRRLARLAVDLLDLSRIDAEVQLRSEPVELGELSRAVLAEFELGTAERGIAISLHDPGHATWVLADPGSVARILRILLDNALRVSPPGGEVRVALVSGAAPGLQVCDEGPGVPPGEREQIFERFHRGRDTTGQAGFGLGLAIGRELAERMGGTLELRDGDRPGAIFALRLPVTLAPDADPLAVA